MGLFESGVSAVIATLFSDDTMFDSLPSIFIKDLFLYGIPAGIFAQLLGSYCRNLKPRSPHRWMWLVLLIPVVTFQLAVVQGLILSGIESGDAPYFRCDLSDLAFAFCIYLGGSLVSGLIAMALIGSWKFLQRKFHRTTLTGNFIPEISW